MAELRWNPLLGTWTLVNADRQHRPHLPDDWCPFCPGEGKEVPPKFDVFSYPNDFPVLTPNPGPVSGDAGGPYRAVQNYGFCDVILYSDEHSTTLSKLSVPHIRKLVDLWSERTAAFSADPKIRYVYIFENRGEAVGATIPHPHGQLYAFPYVPQKLQIELDNSKRYFGENGRCLLCDMNAEESRFGKRVVTENESFVAYLPYFTDYPYGVFVCAKRHFGSLTDMTAAEKDGLAETLRLVTGAFDKRFDVSFPYMMAMHQTPVNSPEYAGAEKYFHFHIEFYPPMRAKDKLKFYASSEMGAWAAANPSKVEETAEELRRAMAKFTGEK